MPMLLTQGPMMSMRRDLRAEIERVGAGLPADATRPTADYLDANDQAFNDKSKVSGMRQTYEAMRAPLEPEFVQMRELGDMFVGRQWTADEKSYREMLGRFVYTLNIMMPQLVAVEGVYLNNRTKTKVIPRGGEDTDLAVLQTEVLNHSFDEAQYYHHLRRVFSDSLIFRRGWRAHSWEYTGRYPDGQYVYRRVNPFDVVFDIDNSDTDVNKGRRLVVNRFLSGDRIMQLYVAHDQKDVRDYIDARMTELEGAKARERRMRSSGLRYQDVSGESFARDRRGGKGSVADSNETGNVSTDYFDSGRGLYRVIELHERRYADRTFIYDQMSGQEVEVSPRQEKAGEIPHILAALGLDSSAVRVRTVPEYWVSVAAPGLTDEVMLMERPYAVQGAQDDLGFAVKCLTAYDQHPDKGKAVGLGDMLSDPQHAINRGRSSKDDIIARYINPDMVGYAESFAEYIDDWKNRKLGAIRRVAGTPGQTPLPEYRYPAPGIAQILDQDMDMLANWAQRITGISPSIQGFKQSSGESGVQADLYRKQSEVMIGPILENLRQQQREDGRFALAMITELMTDARTIRIASETNGSYRYIEVNKFDFLTGQRLNDVNVDWQRFDVEIDDQAFTSMQREEFLYSWMQMLQQIADPALRTALVAEILPLTQLGHKDKIIAVIKRWVSAAAPQLLSSEDQMMAAQMAGGAGGPMVAGGVPGSPAGPPPEGNPMPPDDQMQGIDAPNPYGAQRPVGQPGAQPNGQDYETLMQMLASMQDANIGGQ